MLVVVSKRTRVAVHADVQAADGRTWLGLGLGHCAGGRTW